MKKTIALFALATLLFASGCIGPSLLEQERFKVKDRGAPVECATGECFLNEFKRCGPSRFFVQEEGVKLKSEVHGRSAFGDCVVYVRVEDVNPDEVPQEMKLVAGGLKGMDMACALGDDDIALLTSDGEKGLKFTDELLARCDGPLKPIVQALASSR